MEGLANYGSDDEIDGPPIAADHKINQHHGDRNEMKTYDARHHSRSSSSGPDQQCTIEDVKKSRRRRSIHERKSDNRYKNKEYDDDKYRMKSSSSRDQTYKSEHEKREKRDHDVKKHASREKRYRDSREKRHYKDREDRCYEDRSDRNHATADRHKREYDDTDKYDKEYKKRKEYLPKKIDDEHRDRSDRFEKRYRDDVKYDKYNRKDYSTEKSVNNSTQENLPSRYRDKYNNKSGTPTSTSAERQQSYAHSRSRTPTRHANSNHEEEKKGSYRWHAEENNISKQLRNTAENTTIAISTPTVKKETAATLPIQAHASPSPIPIPNYYNPSVVNVNKYVEQVQKRKLLWSGKKAEDNASKWGKPQFSEDSDGKVASKFLRLMGIKNSESTEVAKDSTSPITKDPNVQSREEMFSSMEQQYEVARQVTHTMRGVGLGFSSQSRPF